jgi:hypothetical protein
MLTTLSYSNNDNAKTETIDIFAYGRDCKLLAWVENIKWTASVPKIEFNADALKDTIVVGQYGMQMWYNSYHYTTDNPLLPKKTTLYNAGPLNGRKAMFRQIRFSCPDH